MKVLVTGCASGFAQPLLSRLSEDPTLELLLGVDRREGGFRHERYSQVVLDLRSIQLEQILRGIHAVIHLAAAAGDAQAASGALLAGTQNLYRFAAAAGVRHVVHLSSAQVYGKTNGKAVGETHPLGAEAGCAAAAALQAVETWLDGFEDQHKTLRVLRLRPHWLLGPHCDSVLARLLRQRATLRQARPTAVQCVHEDDVVEAIHQALHSELAGAFNLACKDSMSLADVHIEKRWLRWPASVERLAARLDTAPGCIEALARPLLLSSRRARSELGWRPRYDNARAILRNS